MKNREKINQMSNKEFAHFLNDRKDFCNDYCIYPKDDCDCCDYFTTECFLEWLESEEESEEE